MPSSSDGGPSPSRGSSPSSRSNPSRRSPPPQSEPDASPAATHQPTAAEGTRSGGRSAGSCSWGTILEKRAKRALILSGPRHGVKFDRLLVLLCHKVGCRSRVGSHIEWHDQAFFCFSRCRK